MCQWWPTSTATAPPPAPVATNVEITASQSNLNLWAHLLAHGHTSSSGSWNVTIGSSAVISSASTSLPAFDTGAFPAGSVVKIVNNGTIVGAGGNGGRTICDEYGNNCVASPATSGKAGGPALRMRIPVTVVNNHRIWGGGGGGGGGEEYLDVTTGGGGGGAGTVAGKAGPVGWWLGADGTLSSGGAGGRHPVHPSYSMSGGDGVRG